MIINFFLKVKDLINIKEFRLRFISTLSLIFSFMLLFFLGNPIISIFFILIFICVFIEFQLILNLKLKFVDFLKIIFLSSLLFIFFILKVLEIEINNKIFDNFNILLFATLFSNLIFFKNLNNLYTFIFSNLIVIAFFSLINILLTNLGLNLFLYLVVLITTMDVFAYIGGKTFGNKKIVPNISKGKTIEGTLIGLFFTIIISLVLKDLVNFNVLESITIGFFIGVLAFLGDLLESVFKRNNGVKDSGKLIPGHGGLLDRFDSYILTLPALNIFLVY